MLLIGIDAASPRVTNLLLPMGSLPNLQRIADEGTYAPLRSLIPLLSPRIWNTIATGKTPEKHGILSFVRKDRHLYRSTDRSAHALWNIVSEAGRSVAVVNWWNSYPPEKINGVMVTDHFLAQEVQARQRFHHAVEENQDAPVAFPLSWLDRLTMLIEPGPALTPFPNYFETLPDLPRWVPRKQLSERFREDSLITRMALAIDEEIRPEVLMVFLPGIDRVSHWLWGSLGAQILLPEKSRFRPPQRVASSEALLTYYRYTDALIGHLLERFGPNDLVMVVSDHGFELGASPIGTTGRHETKAAQDGVFFARGPRLRKPSKEERAPGAISVLDVTPTILAWLGLPLASDMDGKPVPFLTHTPQPPVATYDTAPIERVEAGGAAGEEKMLEQLRALGYIE